MNYREIEDAKYSHLYANGYPSGQTKSVLEYFGYQPDSLIDLGCGLLREQLAPDYCGIDISEFAIQQNRRNWPTLRFHHASITNLSWLVGQWYFCACCDVLEHLPIGLISMAIHQIRWHVDAQRFVFAISCRDSAYRAADGGTLHQTVRGKDFWRQHLTRARFVIGAEAYSTKNKCYFADCVKR